MRPSDITGFIRKHFHMMACALAAVVFGFVGWPIIGAWTILAIAIGLAASLVMAYIHAAFYYDDWLLWKR